ncbi:MAG TPA: hypothetical protein VE219_01360, partial [Candidatus Sulfotelmatobacter sp.]|nr:hypothetical protein [Candidatus Sulfotelmatobacter sp.]
PPGLLPVQVLGVRQSSLAGLTPILGAPPFSGSVDASSVRVLKGSAVYGEDSGPLVIDSPQGLGHTVFIAFDPSQDSFSAWPGSTALLRRILARTHPEGIGVVFAGSNEVSGITQHATALQSAVTTIPPLNLPSAEVLSVVLIVYILAVGPVNFIVLRRMRRLDLTWATVPAISLVAALLAYGTGLGAARYDAVANSIHVLNVEPDGKRAYVESFAAVYLPHGGTHSLLVPKETSFAPLPGVSSADPAVTVDGDSGTVSVEGASASVHGYSSAGYRDLPGGITTALVRRGGHLVGTVSNHLPSTLSNVTVVAPDGSSVTLADIAPGGSDPVDVQESVPGTGFPSPPVPAPLGQGNPLAARGAISRGPAGAPAVTVATCSVNGVQVPCASGGSSCSSNGVTVGCSGGPTTCFVNGLKVPCQSQPITSGSTQEQREQANRDAVLAALRAPSLDQRPRLVALVTRALFPGELSGTNTQTTGLDAVVIPLRTSGASEVRVPGHLVDSPGSSVKVPAFSNIGAQTVLPPGQGAVFEFSLPSTSWQALTLNITGQLQQYRAGNQQTVPVPQAPGGPQAPTVQPTPTATVDVYNVATGAWDAVATRVLSNPATVAVAAPQHVAEDGSLLMRVTANSSTDFLNVPTLDATPLDDAPGAIPGQQTS